MSRQDHRAGQQGENNGTPLPRLTDTLSLNLNPDGSFTVTCTGGSQQTNLVGLSRVRNTEVAIFVGDQATAHFACVVATGGDLVGTRVICCMTRDRHAPNPAVAVMGFIALGSDEARADIKDFLNLDPNCIFTDLPTAFRSRQQPQGSPSQSS
ncbi:hypothetical protein B0I35DRAFT_517101 [Stachybotrys elegans]|uniref:Uncharacterized protein n=1 Tax=Stachybotrys elegans TaxID=80388 RepID=A0A8K0WL21_9HYPO|nr:hypothetical protein B0I35DRAFT_517101 [Stachybotrys elegans]